jgi:hypothetical protein
MWEIRYAAIAACLVDISRVSFMALISVVIPVWNRSASVGRAIDSVLGQLVPGGDAVTCIVVDDGSSDDLMGALWPYGGRVKCVRHPVNRGAAAARNTGVAEAQGEYVAFLDSDDVWLAGKLATQLAAMRENGWMASCAACYLVRSDGREVVAPRYATHGLTQADLVWGCYVSPGSTLILKRDVFARIGPLDTMLARLEDWDWLLRFTATDVLGFLAVPLARIAASHHAPAGPVLAALDRIEQRHREHIAPRYRRQFAAALAFERAAARFRAGDRLATMGLLLRSVALAPIGHQAIRAMLHNRFARS